MVHTGFEACLGTCKQAEYLFTPCRKTTLLLTPPSSEAPVYVCGVEMQPFALTQGLLGSLCWDQDPCRVERISPLACGY